METTEECQITVDIVLHDYLQTINYYYKSDDNLNVSTAFNKAKFELVITGKRNLKKIIIIQIHYYNKLW